MDYIDIYAAETIDGVIVFVRDIEVTDEFIIQNESQVYHLDTIGM